LVLGAPETATEDGRVGRITSCKNGGGRSSAATGNVPPRRHGNAATQADRLRRKLRKPWAAFGGPFVRFRRFNVNRGVVHPDSPMPWKDRPDIAALRMAYNVAVTAHAQCARALTEALMRDQAAPPEIVEGELKARYQRDMARSKLHAAMASALGQPPEPPHKPVR
jgi:hypothetical protein